MCLGMNYSMKTFLILILSGASATDDSPTEFNRKIERIIKKHKGN